jgi:hypothetical protein
VTTPDATPPLHTPEGPQVGIAGLPPFIKRVRRLAEGLAGGAGLGSIGAGGDGRVKIPTLWEFLEMGSPRLALARARGVPFYPWTTSITVPFTSVSPSVQPNVGADSKFSQDMWIESAIARVTSQNTPTNQFDTLSDFFGNFQNAIKCKLYVDGSPRFDIVTKFTNLSNVFDITNPKSLGGWVATYNQQLVMDFSVAFPLAAGALPIELQCTFRCYGPIGEAYSRMTNETAFERLRDEFGIECVDAYVNQCAR